MPKSLWQTLLTAAPLLVLAGCGDGPALHSAGGTITRNGEPLADAVVIFAPSDGATVGAEGVTGPDGKYTLSTGGRSGAPAGKFQVSVTKASPTAVVPEAFKDDPSMADMAPQVGKPKKKTPTKDDPVNALFDAEIAAGDNKALDFDVKVAEGDAPKP